MLRVSLSIPSVNVNLSHSNFAVNYEKMPIRNWNFSTFTSISGQFYETGTESYATLNHYLCARV